MSSARPVWQDAVDAGQTVFAADAVAGVERTDDEDGAHYDQEGWVIRTERWRALDDEQDPPPATLYVLRAARIVYDARQVSEEDGGIVCDAISAICPDSAILLAAPSALALAQWAGGILHLADTDCAPTEEIEVL